MQLLEELFPFVDTSGGGAGSMSGANAMAPTRDSSRYQHQLHHHHHQQQQQHHQQHQQQQGVTPFQVACPLSEHMLTRDLEQGWQEILEMPEMQALDVTAPAQHHHQHQQHLHQQHHHQHQHQQQAPPGSANTSLYSESPDLVDGFCQRRARLPGQSFYPGGGGATAAGGTGAPTGFRAAFSEGCAPLPPLGPEPRGFARSKPEYAATSASGGAGYEEIGYFGAARCVPRHAGAPPPHPPPPSSSAAASPAAGSGGGYQPLPVGPPGATFGSFGVCGGADGVGGVGVVGVAGVAGGGSREQPCARRCLSPGAGPYPDSTAVLLPYADHLGCYGGGSSSDSSGGGGDGGKETYESFGTLGYEAGADGGEEQMPCEMMYLDHRHQRHQQHDVRRGESSTTPDYISFLGASALVDLGGSAGGVCVAASEGGGVCGAAGMTRVGGPLPPGAAAAAGPDCLHPDPLSPPPGAARCGGAAASLRPPPQSGADARPSRDERRAAAMRIPIGVSQIVNVAVDDFNELLARHRLTEPQLALVRDIRRRGKNKVAAQNCRKRKLDGLTGLERELARLRGRREALLTERRDIEEGVAAAERRLAVLRARVFAALRDESGRPYPPGRFCLRHTSDGAVCLVPGGEGGDGGDGDGQASGC
ncbi:uncharacterized protein LOC144736663 [Lampetra planeri]